MAATSIPFDIQRNLYRDDAVFQGLGADNRHPVFIGRCRVGHVGPYRNLDGRPSVRD